MISGTPLDAELQGTLTMPQFSEAGDWSVGLIFLQDRVGNLQQLDTAALAALGFPTTLAVISNQDITPPQLNSFNFAPSAIDVSSGPQSITFTMGLTDSPAGLDFSCPVGVCYTIYLESPSGKQIQVETSQNVTRVSGTPQNGVWQVTVTLPQYAEAGLWKVSYIAVHDLANNGIYRYQSELQSRGFATTFTVTSSPSDTTPPQLTSLAFSPTFVDTTAGSKTITLTMGASDNLSGVNVLLPNHSPNIDSSSYFYSNFVSPSGNQNLYLYPSTLVAGTPHNGTWQATASLPQYSEAGTWTLAYLLLNDAAGNVVTFYNSQLKAMGLPTDLEVILPSLVPDGTISDPAIGGTVKDTVFGDRAQLIAPPGVLTQSTQVALDVFSSDLHLPIPAGFSTTGTNFVNIQLNPEPTLPFPAPGLTLVLPVSNQTAPGTSLTLFRVDPVSGNLTPEPSVTGGSVVGTVNPDGLSATFTGLASLSTVVGLVPTGAVLGDLDGDGQVNCADIAIVRNAFGKKL